jgi:hypothetical protein
MEENRFYIGGRNLPMEESHLQVANANLPMEESRFQDSSYGRKSFASCK